MEQWVKDIYRQICKMDRKAADLYSYGSTRIGPKWKEVDSEFPNIIKYTALQNWINKQ
jgi:hypothetical protein